MKKQKRIGRSATKKPTHKSLVSSELDSILTESKDEENKEPQLGKSKTKPIRLKTSL
jgi:hypothetical protein